MNVKWNKISYLFLIGAMLCFLISRVCYQYYMIASDCEPSGEGLNCMFAGLLEYILYISFFGASIIFIIIFCAVLLYLKFIKKEKVKKKIKKEN